MQRRTQGLRCRRPPRRSAHDRPHHAALPRRPCRQLPAPDVPAGGARAEGPRRDHAPRSCARWRTSAITEIVKFQRDVGPAERSPTASSAAPISTSTSSSSSAACKTDIPVTVKQAPTAPRNWRRR
ncbi:MAG: hypothetical protein MZW92_59315 [Comamonadaceae bacterium]|nr:hypothetical protein [Comamonadaceae bacterium]